MERTAPVFWKLGTFMEQKPLKRKAHPAQRDFTRCPLQKNQARPPNMEAAAKLRLAISGVRSQKSVVRKFRGISRG